MSDLIAENDSENPTAQMNEDYSLSFIHLDQTTSIRNIILLILNFTQQNIIENLKCE